MGYAVLGMVELVLLVYCVLSVITTPDSQVQHLPKLLWLVIVVLLPLAGGIAWLLAGRAKGPQQGSMPYKGNPGRPTPGLDRPRPTATTAPDDDEAFLRGLRERAAEQRRDAERRRRAEGDPAPE